jgi:hypothetical protein
VRLVSKLRTHPWLVVLVAIAAFWTIWLIGEVIFNLGDAIPLEGRAPEVKP